MSSWVSKWSSTHLKMSLNPKVPPSLLTLMGMRASPNFRPFNKVIFSNKVSLGSTTKNSLAPCDVTRVGGAPNTCVSQVFTPSEFTGKLGHKIILGSLWVIFFSFKMTFSVMKGSKRAIKWRRASASLMSGKFF
jgi:hypothetical protein